MYDCSVHSPIRLCHPFHGVIFPTMLLAASLSGQISAKVQSLNPTGRLCRLSRWDWHGAMIWWKFDYNLIKITVDITWITAEFWPHPDEGSRCHQDFIFLYIYIYILIEIRSLAIVIWLNFDHDPTTIRQRSSRIMMATPTSLELAYSAHQRNDAWDDSIVYSARSDSSNCVVHWTIS